MIIVEGMDNSGKSTLCQRLHEETGLEVVHSIKPTSSQALKDNVVNTLIRPDMLILDRVNFISELIYGRVIRGHDILDDYGNYYLQLAAQIGCFFVYCRPPAEKILEFGDREQMEGVRAYGDKLLRCYDKCFEVVRRLMPYYCLYDYTVDVDCQDLLRYIKSYVNTKQQGIQVFKTHYQEMEKIVEHISTSGGNDERQ